LSKKKPLGKGIEKLMQIYQTQKAQQETTSSSDSEVEVKTHQDPDYMQSCPIENIVPNKDQPRKYFSEENLEELSQSIKLNGLLQPILTRKLEENLYEIVAGERRWRASKRAGLKEIPIFVKPLTNKDVLILSLIENVQRQDLTPIEEAKAYNLMLNEYKLTQDEVSDAVSKSRSAVANSVRLLKLPKIVQDFIEEEKITPGHAKILLSLDDNEKIIELANKVFEESLSVRELERIVKEIGTEQETKVEKNDSETPKSETPPIDFSNFISKLSDKFNTKIKIKHGDKKGKILIEYKSMDELQKLTTLLLGEENA